MERSTVIAVDAAPTDAAAVLTLKSGASGFCVWSFDACDAGATISVGACDRCDWQVVAPGVAPIVVLFTGQTLFVKSERLCEKTLLNGAPLWPGWVPLEHGDRIELGNARIDVNIPAEVARQRARSTSSAAACPNDATRYVRSQEPSFEVQAGTTYAPADWYVRSHVESASYVPINADRKVARDGSFESARFRAAASTAFDSLTHLDVQPRIAAGRDFSARTRVRNARSPAMKARHDVQMKARHDVHVITAPQWGAQRVPSSAEQVPEPRALVLEPPPASFAHSRYAAESSSAFIAERSIKHLDRPTTPPVEARASSRPSAAGGDEASLQSAEQSQGVSREHVYRCTVPQWARPQPEAASVLGDRSSVIPAPALFMAKMSRTTYAALGVLTALAYAGWLVVLDHL